MSHLERLEQHIRRKILGYLLVSDLVRQPPDQYLVEGYKFEVNVLRVNRAINKDATAVLYTQNTFVKLHWTMTQTYDAMTNHEVPYYDLPADFKFPHHSAEITINSYKCEKKHVPGIENKHLLLLLDDIPKFTRLLRILDRANFFGFSFQFHLRQPSMSSFPDLETQTKLLLPFEQVRGTAMIQQVAMTGPADAALASRVMQAMTQKVTWLRGGAWEIYDLAVSVKHNGDRAFRLGKAETALSKYLECCQFADAALEVNTMMTGIDMEHDHAMARLHCITRVDTSLVALSDKRKKESGARDYALVPLAMAAVEKAEKLNKTAKKDVMPPSAIARYYHLLGIAELGLEHPVKAGKSFVKAYAILKLPQHKAGWELAKAWKEVSKNEREVRLGSLLASMPKKPLRVEHTKEYGTPEVASELWVMRQLGFQGPIPYEDRIKPVFAIVMTTKPHPNHPLPGPRTATIGEVKPDVLTKYVDMLRKQIALPIAQGKLMGQVALNAEEIGETSIWDDPDRAEQLADMLKKKAGI